MSHILLILFVATLLLGGCLMQSPRGLVPPWLPAWVSCIPLVVPSSIFLVVTLLALFFHSSSSCTVPGCHVCTPNKYHFLDRASPPSPVFLVSAPYTECYSQYVSRVKIGIPLGAQQSLGGLALLVQDPAPTVDRGTRTLLAGSR